MEYFTPESTKLIMFIFPTFEVNDLKQAFASAL